MPESGPIAKPIVLHEINFDEILQESALPVLFEFWASWCPHCTELSPVIDQVASEMAGEIVVGQINCDLNQQLRMRYKVEAVPAFFLAKQGKVIGTTANPKDKDTLISWIKDMLAQQ